FWSFQDGTRKAVDHFETKPFVEATNSLGGAVTDTGFDVHEQRLFNRTNSFIIDPPEKKEPSFVHDTVGLLLKYSGEETYTTAIPLEHQDVSMYTHLTFRAAKKSTLIPALPGPPVMLEVNLVDADGDTAELPADLLKNFAIIPHPFIGSEKPNLSQMVSVRIPLQYFTANGSGVDLTNVAAIVFKTKGSYEIGIDDIEFGK